MNALLVGASPAPDAAALVAELAVEADLVIAVDAGADVCAGAGVVPAILLGDFDSVRPETLSAARLSGTRLVTFPSDKDEADLELAFDEARRLGAATTTLTAVSGGRIDHLLGVIASLRANADLAPRLVEPDSSAWVLAPGGRQTLCVAGQGSVLSLIPLTETAMVSVNGVRWPLDRERLTDRQTRGISNVVTGDVATIEVHEGAVVAVVPTLRDRHEGKY